MSPFQKARAAVVNAFEACGGACPGASGKGLRTAGRTIELRYPAYLLNLEASEVRLCCDDADEVDDPSLLGHARPLDEDLNSDGMLDEEELKQLNEQLTQLHDSKDADHTAIKDKLTELFGSELLDKFTDRYIIDKFKRLFGHGRLEEEKRNPTTVALEKLISDLFRLQDLNNDGMLDEEELIKLNEKISQLHYGKDIDRTAINDKFTELFRSELDRDGNPVDSTIFRRYMLKVLDGLDRNRQAQEMIAEQFVAEAKSGRAAFRCTSLQSTADNPFLPPVISIDSIANLQTNVYD